MKNTIISILIMLGVALVSCNQEEAIVTNVQLNPSFIIMSQGDNEPMRVKSSVMATDSVVYAIQVYENGVEYYYGLFNDVSMMQIALTTSKSYKFKVTAFKTGTGKGLKTLIDADGVNYYLPNKIPLKNMFIKGDLLKDIDLTSSIILNGQQKDYPEVDGFYATKTITLEKGTTSVDFALLRMGFGLNLNVDALTSGNMEVYIGNDTIKLNSTTTSASTVRLFNVLNGNFTNIYSKADTYGDSILLKVKWAGTDGTIVNTQGKYLFNRNYQKTINIQLNTLTGGLSLENWKFPSDGLVAWYPFNGNANDESGNGYNATNNGSVLSVDRFGNSNKCYYFNGTSNYINLNVKLPNIFSVSVWVNVEQYKSFTLQDIGSKFLTTVDNNYPFTGYEISVDVPSKNGMNWTGFWNTITSPTQSLQSSYLIDLNKWYFLSATYDGTKLSYYFNGLLDKSINATFVQNNTSIMLGARRVPVESGNYNFFLQGKLDDVGIWNRVLSQEEIATLYNYYPSLVSR